MKNIKIKRKSMHCDIPQSKWGNASGGMNLGVQNVTQKSEQQS